MARAKRSRADLDCELAGLATMPLAQLRERWSEIMDKPVPRVSAAMLRLAIAWEIQATVHGGLSRQVTQRLDQFEVGKSKTGILRPGMRLVREWNGSLHVVTIAEDGAIIWNDRCWPSLSKLAREITGTRWSGPAFFGLKRAA